MALVKYACYFVLYGRKDWENSSSVKVASLKGSFLIIRSRDRLNEAGFDQLMDGEVCGKALQKGGLINLNEKSFGFKKGLRRSV